MKIQQDSVTNESVWLGTILWSCISDASAPASHGGLNVNSVQDLSHVRKRKQGSITSSSKPRRKRGLTLWGYPGPAGFQSRSQASQDRREYWAPLQNNIVIMWHQTVTNTPPPSWSSCISLESWGGPTRRGYGGDRVWDTRSRVLSSDRSTHWSGEQKISGQCRWCVVRYSVPLLSALLHYLYWPAPRKTPDSQRSSTSLAGSGCDIRKG